VCEPGLDFSHDAWLTRQTGRAGDAGRIVGEGADAFLSEVEPPDGFEVFVCGGAVAVRLSRDRDPQFAGICRQHRGTLLCSPAFHAPGGHDGLVQPVG
jgi:hypothetical protein